jgi:uncharacterized RDD family membrane protein YckC
MDQDLTILSPEKTILTYRLAGLGSRVTAQILDLILVGITLYALSLVSMLIGAVTDMHLAQGFVMFIFVALPFAYFILFEGLWNGQTFGKKASGIRVRMADGTPVTFLAALGRNIMRPADMMPGPYFVGFLAIFTNPKSQRLGDLIANTVVCYEKKSPPMFAVAPHIVGYHPLEIHVGDLRGMTQEEYYALRRFCDRFPELSTSTQARLLENLWKPIAIRRSVPSLPNVHPIYLAEAVVMKFGREKGLL